MKHYHIYFLLIAITFITFFSCNLEELIDNQNEEKQIFSINENNEEGMAIGTINLSDNIDVQIYSIIDGNIGEVFDIDENGQLIAIKKIDHEILSRYTITVQVVNQEDQIQVIKIIVNINDIKEEQPNIIIPDYNNGDIITTTKDTAIDIPTAIATADNDGVIDVIITHDINFNKIGDYTITYKATDNVGNTATATITIKVTAVVDKDTTPPVITITGYNNGATIQKVKGSPISIPTAIATDDIDQRVNVIITQNVDFNNVGDYTVTYQATDTAGNIATATITIKVTAVADTTPPVITIAGYNNDDTIQTTRTKSIPIPTATATDQVDGTVNVVRSGTVDFNTVGNYIITYKAIDNANNTATATVTIQVIEDDPPVITIVGHNNGDTLQTTRTKLISIPTATATDQVDRTVNVVRSGTVDFNTVGSYTITYTARDSANNTATATVTIQVIEDDPPVITIASGAYNNGDIIQTTRTRPISIPTATATDQVDGTVSVIISGTVDFNTIGDYTITYTARDSANNIAIATVTIKVTALADTTPPVITIALHNNGDTIQTTRTKSIPIPTATATDQVDGTVNVVRSGTVDFNTVGSYTITYTARDSANNTATATVTIKVIEDDPPVITIALHNNRDTIQTTRTKSIPIPTATATDQVDGTVNVVRSGTVDFNTVGSYTITYTARDSANNTATATVTIQVIEDDPPVITIASGAYNNRDTIKTTRTKSIPIPPATATDQVDGPVNVIVTQSVDFNTLGNYTVTYTAKDTANNTATATITIKVIEDDPPVITIAGHNNGATIQTTRTKSIPIPPATATDQVDVSVNVIVTQNVNFNTVGNYTVTYKATDSANNTATATITIQVIEDNPPELTILGYNNGDTITTTKNKVIGLPGFTVTDDVDLSAHLTISDDRNSIDFSIVGTQIITYSVTDTAGNKVTATINVQILTDNPPVITINNYNNGDILTIRIGQSFTYPQATATDDIDASVQVTHDRSVDIRTAGSYTINYLAKDSANNVSSALLNVIVKNTLLNTKTPSVAFTLIGPLELSSIQTSISNNTDKNNVIIAGIFNILNLNNNQVIYETGSSTLGTTIAIDNNDHFVVSIGADNNKDIDIDANIVANQDYAFVIEINLDTDKVRVWLETVNDPNLIFVDATVKGEADFTGNSWADDEKGGLGTVVGTAQGNYTSTDTLQITNTPVINIIRIYSAQLVNIN